LSLLAPKRFIDGVDGFFVVTGGDADDDVQLTGTLVNHADVDARARECAEDAGGDTLLEIALLQHVGFSFFFEI